MVSLHRENYSGTIIIDLWMNEFQSKQVIIQHECVYSAMWISPKDTISL